MGGVEEKTDGNFPENNDPWYRCYLSLSTENGEHIEQCQNILAAKSWP